MKKSAFIITGLLIATQSFATGISGNSATCDSGALGSEDGSVAMRANYEPESIGLRWYDENNNLLSVSNASQSCTYGGTITIPNPPTKTGYKFTGWKIINIFSTLDYNISTTWDATHSRWKPINGSGYTMETAFGTENSSDLSNGEWSDTFSYGTVMGNALCSDSNDNGKTFAQTGNPGNATTGQYCWCKATGYQPSGSDVIYSPSSPLPWVFHNDTGSASGCAWWCESNCARTVQNNADFRRPSFGQ